MSCSVYIVISGRSFSTNFFYYWYNQAVIIYRICYSKLILISSQDNSWFFDSVAIFSFPDKDHLHIEMYHLIVWFVKHCINQSSLTDFDFFLVLSTSNSCLNSRIRHLTTQKWHQAFVWEVIHNISHHFVGSISVTLYLSASWLHLFHLTTLKYQSTPIPVPSHLFSSREFYSNVIGWNSFNLFIYHTSLVETIIPLPLQIVPSVSAYHTKFTIKFI